MFVRLCLFLFALVAHGFGVVVAVGVVGVVGVGVVGVFVIIAVVVVANSFPSFC